MTLDILRRILHKARRSNELTRELSKPFIPSSAILLFPLRIKRVRKAVDAYLEKVSGIACSRFQLMYLSVDSSLHHPRKQFKVTRLEAAGSYFEAGGGPLTFGTIFRSSCDYFPKDHS